MRRAHVFPRASSLTYYAWCAEQLYDEKLHENHSEQHLHAAQRPIPAVLAIFKLHSCVIVRKTCPLSQAGTRRAILLGGRSIGTNLVHILVYTGRKAPGTENMLCLILAEHQLSMCQYRAGVPCIELGVLRGASADLKKHPDMRYNVDSDPLWLAKRGCPVAWESTLFELKVCPLLYSACRMHISDAPAGMGKN